MQLLLIAREWRPRTLILAELQEAGYEVLAVGSWDEAELLLSTRAVTPGAVVFDLDGEPNPPAALRTLLRLVPPARVVVLTTSVAMPADELRSIGPGRILARPFSVGDVLTSLRELSD